jgi:hypothetical protein
MGEHMRRFRVILLGVLLGTLFLSGGVSAEVKGTFFPESRLENETLLVLQGIGLKRVFFMRAFVAGFYLEEDIPIEEALTDVPKRIEVSYFVRIPGEKLAHYTEKMMRLNMGEDEYAALSESVKQMGEYFVDLHPGDRYALTYIPETGTQFEYNGQVVGLIEGEDFARGIFSVWIGGVPMDKHLKDQILGVAAMDQKKLLEVALFNGIDDKVSGF